jgi:UDP-N-acetylmuramoyl-tripeptide--D-alanyl-D-alanine ligase
MKLSNMAEHLAGEIRGVDVEFTGISTDTRAVQGGEVFFALSGEHFDAHDFLDKARQGGAVAAVVSRWVELDLPQIKVSDTRLALGQWAAHVRLQYNPRVVAVTGSCGKTSVKEMLAAILAQQGNVLSTQGNFNNDIGAPLTLLRLNESHDYAVIELGANHMGEIAYTVGLTQPDVAMITNVGDAHLEGFGSRENISRAKSEIYGGLKPDGIAVINLDDDFSPDWLALNKQRRCRTFSLDNSAADVFAQAWQLDSVGKPTITVSVDGRMVNVTLNVLGKHQVINALGAIAAATAMGASLESVVNGLQALMPFKGRMYPRSLGKWQWVEDSYNANPTSMHAAIDFLAQLPEPRALVLGRMGELGTTSSELHAGVGEYAARAGIRLMFTSADNASDYLQGFRRVTSEGQVYSLENQAAVAARLIEVFPAGTVLVKGSRSAAMEKVFDEAAHRLAQGEIH